LGILSIQKKKSEYISKQEGRNEIW
jgi:hypothetical protein